MTRQITKETTWLSDSPEATVATGREIASRISQPLAIGISGTLGAGKTLLSRGIIAGLGVDPDSVASPTFTICHQHRGTRWTVFHVDLYRIRDDDELLELGPEQWLDGDGVSLIEWADRFPWFLAECSWQVHIQILAGEQRRIALLEM